MKSKILIMLMALFLLLPLGSAFAASEYEESYFKSDSVVKSQVVIKYKVGNDYYYALTDKTGGFDWTKKESQLYISGSQLFWGGSGTLFEVYKLDTATNKYSNSWTDQRYSAPELPLDISVSKGTSNIISSNTTIWKSYNGIFSDDDEQVFFSGAFSLKAELKKIPQTMKGTLVNGGLLSVALIIFAILLGVGLLPRLKSWFLR